MPSRRHAPGRWGSRLINIALPYLWLAVFLLLPIAIVAKISLSEPALSQPPYSALWEWLEQGVLLIRLDLQSYQLIWTEFFANSDWPLAAALAVVLLLLLVVPFVLMQRWQQGSGDGSP